jgi:hypothetical protein
MARATPGASEDLASHCLVCARPLGTSSGRAREKEGRAGRCFAATGENHRGGRTLAVTRYGVAGSGKRGCGAGREAAVIHHCRDRATSAQLRRRQRRGRNGNAQAATTRDTSELARSCRSIPASGSKRPNPQLRRHELDETPGESLLPHHAALEGLPARLRCATGVLARPLTAKITYRIYIVLRMPNPALTKTIPMMVRGDRCHAVPIGAEEEIDEPATC